jgi:hypothetical protein
VALEIRQLIRAMSLANPLWGAPPWRTPQARHRRWANLGRQIGRAFARKIEAAYRTIWQHWCETTDKTPEQSSVVAGLCRWRRSSRRCRLRSSAQGNFADGTNETYEADGAHEADVGR